MKGIDVARGFGESECRAKDDNESDFPGIPLAGTALLEWTGSPVLGRTVPSRPSGRNAD